MVAETAAPDAAAPAADDAAAPDSDDAAVAAEDTAQTRTLDEVTGDTEEPDSKKAKVGMFT